MPVLGFLKVQRLTRLTIKKTMNIDQAKKIVISVISKILEGKVRNYRRHAAYRGRIFT